MEIEGVCVDINFFTCKHQGFLDCEHAHWCGLCEEWMKEFYVGEMRAEVDDTGDIKVSGSGYIDPSLIMSSTDSPPL